MNSMPPPEELSGRIARLIDHGIPGARDIAVASVAPMFGGNARKAWSFDLSYRLDADPHRCPCVLLSQTAGRQIDTDVAQEYRLLQALKGTGTRVPRALAMDASGEIIGSPSIILERLPGKASAVDFLNGAEQTGQRLTQDLVSVVAQLHAVDISPAAYDSRLQGLSMREVAARQVVHWYETFLAERMEPMPVMSAQFYWLREHVPEPQRIGLVHGDLRPGNFLYQGDRVTGLLDWEMAHFGDPVEDLGWIYRPMWSPERFVPLRTFATCYGEIAGRPIPWANVIYYRIFSELKFATISLAAARAFATGRTRNLRHIDRAATVAPCLRRCLDWIDLHRLEVPRV